MDLPDAEHTFLRELVKGSRQKLHHVTWVDRDGTDRLTTLTQTEAVRLNVIASRLGTSKSEVLRRAAHIPVKKTDGKNFNPANPPALASEPGVAPANDGANGMPLDPSGGPAK